MGIPKAAKEYADRYKTATGIVDFYKFLDVPRTASDDEITHAMMKKASIVEATMPENYLKITLLGIAQKHLGTPGSRSAYDRKLANKGAGVYMSMLIDFILFFALPALAYNLANEARIIEDDIFRALMISLASAVVAYIATFSMTGRYTELNLRQRGFVILPAMMFASVYWVVLAVSEIADGYGEGNVLVLLFGLAVTGAITWRRILASNSSHI